MPRHLVGRYGKPRRAFLQESLLVGHHRRLAGGKGAPYGA